MRAQDCVYRGEGCSICQCYLIVSVYAALDTVPRPPLYTKPTVGHPYTVRPYVSDCVDGDSFYPYTI